MKLDQLCGIALLQPHVSSKMTKTKQGMNSQPDHSRSRFFVVLVGICLMFFASACKKQSTNEEALSFEVDRICDSFRSATKVHGMVVGIWSEEKGFSYLKASGYSNIQNNTRMDAHGLFRIGSNTKTFTVTTILQLVDEGKLHLNDSLSKFFPGFKNGDLITLRMLCNMTSGIPNYTDDDVFAQTLDANPLKKWGHQELINLIINRDFKAPGVEMKYSNSNTVLLGMIIEQITGKSLTQNFQERFYSRQPLPNTYMPETNTLSSNAIRGYMNYTDSTQYNDDVSTMYDPSWAWAAGAMVSDVDDVKRWVKQLIRGNLISDSLLQQRFQGVPVNGNVYGLGMFSYGHDMWGHNGGLPGYTSIMMSHRKKDITYVIFFNWQNHNALPDDLYKRLVSVVDPEI